MNTISRRPESGVFLDDVRAGDVGGHQVGRELDAAEVEIEDLGHRLDDERLGEPGNAREDAVATHEEGSSRTWSRTSSWPTMTFLELL